jgi:hypothetical protein
MIEGLIIGLLIGGFAGKPYFGKQIHELSPVEYEKLYANYNKTYAKFYKKGQQPPLTIEQHMEKLKKSGKTSFIAAAIVVPIYILLLIVICSSGALNA